MWSFIHGPSCPPLPSRCACVEGRGGGLSQLASPVAGAAGVPKRDVDCVACGGQGRAAIWIRTSHCSVGVRCRAGRRGSRVLVGAQCWGPAAARSRCGAVWEQAPGEHGRGRWPDEPPLPAARRHKASRWLAALEKRPARRARGRLRQPRTTKARLRPLSRPAGRRGVSSSVPTTAGPPALPARVPRTTSPNTRSRAPTPQRSSAARQRYTSARRARQLRGMLREAALPLGALPEPRSCSSVGRPPKARQGHETDRRGYRGGTGHELVT